MDVVTLGEAMVLFVPTSVAPLRFAGTFEKTIGGAEANVAIALARLGHQVGWMSRLGNDEFGLYVRQYIRGEGVDTSRVFFDDQHPTAVFFKERQLGQDPKIYFYRKGSAASHMSPGDLDEAYLAQAKYLHLTGILPALSASCRALTYQVIELAKKRNVRIVFDPNIRLKLWSMEEARPVLMDIAAQCDIVLPGLEEGELLTGASDERQIGHILLQNGAKAVVVKLGERGAYYVTPEGGEYVAGYEVKQIVDTVGAGDGFAAGFLSGLLRGWGYREAVKLGNRVGSYALTVPGDVEGYPFWSQIDPAAQGKTVLR
ncbi:sugar kinase [Brevibacillus fulvus]|uniref:2-dehydro-3-deoxygluconokinase n=1 Tax=Brevibacillus fulvus TaxID=1125967 RepID=A0A938XX02_9BACL|nr:sugar kinase [Brevibacillus fulvus]MBM7589235.1 2-dehydro-3-deoxygluconokinase [Brevibacillus fulvus]